jgi:hypothetical protein
MTAARTSTSAPWDRLLWAVKMYPPVGVESPYLLGEVGDATRPAQAAHVPMRILLFTARRDAREWCRAHNATWRARSDSLRKWRVRPVRVRETVTEVTR